MKRRFSLVWAALLIVSGASWAGEPEVAFRVEDGWVRFAVTRDEQGVADVALKVVDGPGAPFVEGEADEKGVGAFPAPASQDCVITFLIAGKETDPILLMFADKKLRVEPERVQLTYDRRPCCSLVRLKPAGGTGGTFPWLFWTEILVGITCLSGFLWLCRRREIATDKA